MALGARARAVRPYDCPGAGSPARPPIGWRTREFRKVLVHLAEGVASALMCRSSAGVRGFRLLPRAAPHPRGVPGVPLRSPQQARRSSLFDHRRGRPRAPRAHSPGAGLPGPRAAGRLARGRPAHRDGRAGRRLGPRRRLAVGAGDDRDAGGGRVRSHRTPPHRPRPPGVGALRGRSDRLGDHRPGLRAGPSARRGGARGEPVRRGLAPVLRADARGRVLSSTAACARSGDGRVRSTACSSVWPSACWPGRSSCAPRWRAGRRAGLMAIDLLYPALDLVAALRPGLARDPAPVGGTELAVVDRGRLRTAGRSRSGLSRLRGGRRRCAGRAVGDALRRRRDALGRVRPARAADIPSARCRPVGATPRRRGAAPCPSSWPRASRPSPCSDTALRW